MVVFLARHITEAERRSWLLQTDIAQVHVRILDRATTKTISFVELMWNGWRNACCDKKRISQVWNVWRKFQPEVNDRTTVLRGKEPSKIKSNACISVTLMIRTFHSRHTNQDRKPGTIGRARQEKVCNGSGPHETLERLDKTRKRGYVERNGIRGILQLI